MKIIDSFYDAAKLAVKNQDISGLNKTIDVAYKFLKETKITAEDFTKFQGFVYKIQKTLYFTGMPARRSLGTGGRSFAARGKAPSIIQKIVRWCFSHLQHAMAVVGLSLWIKK